jgi:MFS family permease
MRSRWVSSGAQADSGGHPPSRMLAPLYAAGFTSAFGAHSIAAGIGAEAGDIGIGLLTFGVLLAVYDVAEIILKPIFGSLSDRIGIKPVIVAGLALFAITSSLGVFATTPLLLGIVRLGQGAAASAFSPASSAAVARLAGPTAAGRYFGKYGSWKGLGYAIGPLLGAGLLGIGGLSALFLVLTVFAAGTAVWVLLTVSPLSVLPRPHYTFTDLISQTVDRSFLIPVLALACATASLGVAVGFLPLLGSRLQLPVFASMGAVTVVALASTVTQPVIGRLHDSRRLTAGAGIGAGLGTVVAGMLVLAVAPSPTTLYVVAALIGLGIGVTTPLGFAHLALATPAERMGRTMGNAELGREVGDAGGPLVVGAIAAASLSAGLIALASLVAATAVVSFSALSHAGTPPER